MGGLSARLEAMLSSTRLGSMTLGDFHRNRGEVVSWMLQQRNCGRRTVNELVGILDTLPRPAVASAPALPEPPLADIQLHDLLAADELSARLLDAIRTTDLRTMTLADYVRNRNDVESRLLRLPNFGRRSVNELRGLVGTHVRRQLETEGADPTQFGSGFAAFVAAAPVTAPEFTSPPADCDLRAMLEWHLGRLPPRTADILKLRFGLNGEPAMTLQDIGDLYDITRERIRQIEVKGLKGLRSACRRFPVRPFIDASTPGLLDAVFAGRSHGTTAQLERGVALLDGWIELALCLSHGGTFSWLTAAATRFGDGWLTSTVDPAETKEAAETLRRRADGRPFPRSCNELQNGIDPTLAGAAMDLVLGWRVEAGYVFARRPGPRLRRTALLHALLSDLSHPSEMVPLLQRYHTIAPDDRCTDRDLVIVMEAASHLFLEIHEGCWTAVGDAAPLQAVVDTDAEQSDTLPEANEQDEGTNATALERELDRVGPCRMGELMRRAIDILPEGRSRHSVGPTLLSNPSRFVRVLPGVYALPHQVLDGRELVQAGATDYLLNPTQARFYAVARKSGERWGAYPLWTPTAEMRLCRWARAAEDRPLYRSLLDVASIGEWPTDDADKDVWRDLQSRDGRFELWSEPTLSGLRPPLDRVLAAAIRLTGDGTIGWVAANRILGYVPSSYAGAGLLAGMVAAGMAVARDDPSAWQLPHAPGPLLADWVERLVAALHESGIIDWDAGVGSELALAFSVSTAGLEVSAEEPEEMDEYERIMAEHRRSVQARRIEAQLELEAE